MAQKRHKKGRDVTKVHIENPQVIVLWWSVIGPKIAVQSRDTGRLRAADLVSSLDSEKFEGIGLKGCWRLFGGAAVVDFC